MNSITEAGVTIAMGIVGLATLAILVSSKANTTGVIQNIASGFVNSLGVAEAPVTGASYNINTAYASSSGLGGMGSLSMPSMTI